MRVARTVRWLPGNSWLPSTLAVECLPFKVYWADLRALPLSHQFFAHSLEHVRGMLGNTEEIVTNIETLFDASSLGGSLLSPSGIVFHITRCGSTLIGNFLRTSQNTTVVSEAAPFAQVLDAGSIPGTPRDGEVVRREMLNALVRIFARYGSHEPNKVVLKLHAFGLLAIERARACWPDVPFLILIRNPIDVIVSNISRPAGWLQWRSWPRNEQQGDWSLSPNHEEMNDEEYCGRAIGALCEAGIRGRDDKCLVVCYENIDATTFLRVRTFFGLPSSDVQAQDIRNILSIYSKDPDRQRPFHDEQQQSINRASKSVEVAAWRWAMEPYLRLREYEGLGLAD
jgi:hypothetical protein